MRTSLTASVLAVTLALGAFVFPAVAVTPELARDAAIARLGRDLTPLGAEVKGNADGSIPAYTGGLPASAVSRSPNGHYADPFATEKPLYTITRDNLEQHRSKLSTGHQELFRRYPDYAMPVYRTHRTAAYAKKYYEESIANARRARLSNDGNGVVGTRAGLPFPVASSGLEAIWNHLLRYRGDSYAFEIARLPVQRDGSFTPVRLLIEADYHYGNFTKADSEREDNKLLNYYQYTLAPSRLAGNILLTHETVDQARQPRSVWVYNPGQRRVRLAPQVAYDNPQASADGMAVNDESFMYNGATDRYEWKLLGKREMLVPYNSYRVSGTGFRFEEIARPGFPEPSLMRYELHRVWVVEATLKPGTSHIYSKRIFYLDEDSWTVLMCDKYDARGTFYRFAEQHVIQMPEIPMLYPTVEINFDPDSGRYMITGLRNDSSKVFELLKPGHRDYTPTDLRGQGRR